MKRCKMNTKILTYYPDDGEVVHVLESGYVNPKRYILVHETAFEELSCTWISEDELVEINEHIKTLKKEQNEK